MTASVQILHGRNGKYHTHGIQINENEPGELEGRLFGAGAEKLSLDEPIKQNDKRFSELLNGINPENLEPLRQLRNFPYTDQEGNLKTRKAVTGYDITLSPPKSYSVLWATSDKDTRLKLEAIHQAGVRAVATYVQDNLVLSRAGKGGGEAEKVAPIFCKFSAFNFKREPATASYPPCSLKHWD